MVASIENPIVITTVHNVDSLNNRVNIYPAVPNIKIDENVRNNFTKYPKNLHNPDVCL